MHIKIWPLKILAASAWNAPQTIEAIRKFIQKISLAS